jgi:hypothetical protein
MRQLSITGLIILLAIITALLVANLPEIQRYLRIRSM